MGAIIITGPHVYIIIHIINGISVDNAFTKALSNQPTAIKDRPIGGIPDPKRSKGIVSSASFLQIMEEYIYTLWDARIES